MSSIAGMPFPAGTGDDITNASKRMADLEAYNKAKPSNKVSKKAMFFKPIIIITISIVFLRNHQMRWK